MHRIFRHPDRNMQLFREQLVQPVKQRTAARQDDSPVNNICRQLRRCTLQHRFGRSHNHRNRVPQGFLYLAGRNRERLGKSAYHVPSSDVHLGLHTARADRTDRNLDILSGAFTDKQFVFLLDIF
ncbi:hypothetical protein D3C79_798220 [compost metagenome]